MEYFVLWPDGQRFGPATEDVLRLWAAERRIGPYTILVEGPTGRQIQASQLPSLNGVFSSPSLSAPNPTQGLQAPQPGQQGQWYTRPSSQMPVYSPYQQQGSNTETTIAWVCSALGLLCCPLVSVVGIVFAIIGMSKKQSTAVGALILGIIGLVGVFFLRGLLSM